MVLFIKIVSNWSRCWIPAKYFGLHKICEDTGFADPYSPIQRQNHGFLDSVLIRENKGKSVKTRNLAYFMQHCGNLMRKSK